MGRILNIQRMSTEDGPGLRTTAFFKGCPLSCTWCHNPESISRAKELEFFDTRCIYCGTCAKVCPNGVITIDDEGLHIDRESCAACMICAATCPTTALEPKGKDMSAHALADELLKDTAYFSGGGGITLSGGEALMQCDFAAEVLRIAKESGVHTAVDTCGVVPRAAIDKCLPYTDLILYDIKLIDSDAHKRYTGAGNAQVLANVIYVAEAIRGSETKLWVRTPVIPGATDGEENIRGIAAFIRDNIADTVERWELCAFNNLCVGKYARLGKQWAFEGVAKMAEADMQRLRVAAIAEGIDADKVICTGTTRSE